MSPPNIISTPLGNIGIKLHGSAVTDLLFEPSAADVRTNQSDPKAVVEALEAYFNNPLHKFELPLLPSGTDFQKRVWEALRAIPSGTTLTYGELAKRLQSSARAVGQACRRNPIPIIIPCHRVTSSRGLGGYMGKTHGLNTDIKRWLLRHEKAATATR